MTLIHRIRSSIADSWGSPRRWQKKAKGSAVTLAHKSSILGEGKSVLSPQLFKQPFESLWFQSQFTSEKFVDISRSELIQEVVEVHLTWSTKVFEYLD